ncbi:hypothetical protein GCM10023332_13670 [Luteimonas vadosa]|uniref:AsmA-like C-terminal domain-containing protein n=1 Tax=Luteimonas vadosa TaxID=1165507 RepID=A0ABP9E1D5_9GAMM
MLSIPPAQARTLSARIARVTTAVATLEDVRVELDWPASAPRGELRMRAARVDADGLGYRFRSVAWRCPLERDGPDRWRCDGEVRAAGGAPLRLAIDLASGSTDASLSRGSSRVALQRSAATPDLTTLDLTRVPLLWTQALASRAWADGRLQAGTLDGALRVHTPKDGPLRVHGTLRLDGGALETPDARIAAQGLGGRFDIDYRRQGATTLVAVDATLEDGDLLYGNTYVGLPATPVALAISAVSEDGAGWDVPRFSWIDGRVLTATGSAGFTPAGDLQYAEVDLHSDDMQPLGERYLSGWLGLAGLTGLEMRGAFDARLRVAEAGLQAFDARVRGVDLRAADNRFRFDGLDGDVRYSADAPVDSRLRWRSGALGDVAFGPGVLPLRSGDGALTLVGDASIPLLKGALSIHGLEIRPPAGGKALELRGGLALDGLELGALAKALGGPEFGGTLSGRIPSARYVDNRLVFDGGLTMQVFDGTVHVSALEMERPFGVAPTLSANLDLDGLDLLLLTEVFDFGSITGRLHGRIHDLRLVDWTATAFDAELHTEPRKGVRQRISQRAVQNISSVGDASFVSSLQGRLIGLFDDFGYRRIGISCQLVNEVCLMGGLASAGNAFTIVEGSGIPRLTVVGYNRLVDWPTLVERVAAVGKGDVKPVFD